MSQYITKIKTNQGDKQIDYNALANLPTPDTTLSVSGQSADAKAVGDALDDMSVNFSDVLDGMSAKFSNPNLLINSDFRNPVNQRGQTILTVDDNQWTKVYFIDRWYAQHGATVELLDGCIKASASTTTTSGYFCQVFESALPSDTYTATINVKSVSGTANVYLKSGDNPPGMHLTEGINVITATAPLKSIEFQILPGSIVEIYWVKLEQGSIATPFISRLYEEDLLICRRYYRKYWTSMLLPQFYENQYCGFVFDTPMRGDPTVKTFSILSTSNNSSIGANVEVTAQGVYKFHTISSYTGKTILVPMLELDAEIY